MEESKEAEIGREELKKEFQLERMILFSDAVFAVVITLMAIEIKIPETVENLTSETFETSLFHLAPVIIAYILSFVFIGGIWYQHLKILSLLRDYDKGLVVRNLLLFFFVSLFPFGAALISRAYRYGISYFVYVGIVMACVFSQYLLYHYILVEKPALRFNMDIEEHLTDLRNSKITLLIFSISIALTGITYFLIPSPQLKPLAMLWGLLVLPFYNMLVKKKTK